MNLSIRPKEECKYDAVSLGEVMLRLDPGEGRIRTARSFRVWEGGGEYNVARGLRRCFGLNTAVITAFAENETGLLLEDLILQGGVDTYDTKIIGIYSSEEIAMNVIKKYKKIIGFNKYPEDFYIDKYKMDENRRDRAYLQKRPEFYGARFWNTRRPGMLGPS